MDPTLTEPPANDPNDPLAEQIFTAATAGAYLCFQDLGSRSALRAWLRQELAWTGDLTHGLYQRVVLSPCLRPWQQPDHPHNRLARFIRRQAGGELDSHCAVHHTEA